MRMAGGQERASVGKRILPECAWGKRRVRITTPLAGLAQIDSYS